MKAETADALREAADSMGLELQVRDDYSGRGMYGKTTHAVVADLNTLFQCIAYAASAVIKEDDIDDFVHEIGRTHRDSMGRSELVIY